MLAAHPEPLEFELIEFPVPTAKLKYGVRLPRASKSKTPSYFLDMPHFALFSRSIFVLSMLHDSPTKHQKTSITRFNYRVTFHTFRLHLNSQFPLSS